MRKKALKLPWYAVPENLNVLRDWALRLVPGHYVKITFKSDLPTGRFCRYKAASFIEVNPNPYRELDDGTPEPIFKSQTAQWNACRAILAHEEAHYLFTTVYEAKPGSTLAWLINVLEDRRIELLFARHEWAVAPLFRRLGNRLWKLWRDKRLAEQKAGVTLAPGDLLLAACLYWRWAVGRISNRTFCLAAFGHAKGATSLWDTWEKIRGQVEAAWVAPNTAVVQDHAEQILKLLGIAPEKRCSSELEGDSGNPYGELDGDGTDRPARARGAKKDKAKEGAPAEGEGTEPDPASEATAGDAGTSDEGESADATGAGRGEDASTADGAYDRDDDSAIPGDPLSEAPFDAPDVTFDGDCEMLPAPFGQLVADAEPLAAALLRVPPVRTLTVPHDYRGAYSFRREFRTPDRPNLWTVTSGGGGKRALSICLDSSGSNDFRMESIRLALMALRLAATRERYNFSLVACGQGANPHYTVIQQHNSCDETGDLARIAGLDAPYGNEFLAWGMETAGEALLRQPERDKTLLVLTDAELVYPGDWNKSTAWLDKMAGGDLRIVGILITEPDSEARDRRCLRDMQELFSRHTVLSCCLEDLPQALNATLMR